MHKSFFQSNEGYLSEIFSSIQGEGGTVRGSCFGKRQIFLRFSGCNLAEGEYGSKGCFWCDSIESQKFNVDYLKYEIIPNSEKFKQAKNPINSLNITEFIKALITPDLHSFSFTGGEPLCQLNFILNISKELKKCFPKIALYLETNGSILPNDEEIKEIAKLFQFCCCDIKDKSSRAASKEKWKNLVDTELEFINKMTLSNVDIFAKIVVTSHTEIQEIECICENLSRIKYPDGKGVGLAIQPAILEHKKDKIKLALSSKMLNSIFYHAAKYINPESLTLSIQIHKFLGVL